MTSFSRPGEKDSINFPVAGATIDPSPAFTKSGRIDEIKSQSPQRRLNLSQFKLWGNSIVAAATGILFRGDPGLYKAGIGSKAATAARDLQHNTRTQCWRGTQCAEPW